MSYKKRGTARNFGRLGSAMMMDVSGVALEVQRLRKSFATSAGIHEVLREVSLSVRAGEWVSVMGRSGSGKSTLLRCCSGLTGADSGSAVVAGVNVAAASQDRLARLRRSALGFVFQDYNLIEPLTARQNVGMPLLLETRGARRHRVDIDRAVEDALARTGVTELADQRASTLSGGEQQRVAIARALAQHPVVLFADEPTGALDSVSSKLVLDLFHHLTQQGTAVLMVTHDLDAAACSDRVLILVDGKIEHDFYHPTAEQLFGIMKGGERV